MADIPDFVRITQRIVDEHVGSGDNPAAGSRSLRRAIVDALRNAWNARGAADINTIELQFAPHIARSAPPSMKSLDRALRALDYS
jgi:hypothetical protein